MQADLSRIDHALADYRANSCMLSDKQEADTMFYLSFTVAPKTAVSAADALRQKTEWEALGAIVEVKDRKGNVMTALQLRDW
jgi:hypothetical protein